MQEIISKIATSTGLSVEKSEQAVGILLGLIKTQGHKVKVDEMFAMMPGASEIVAKYDSGLMGKLAGGMMGGPLAAITKMQAIGVSTEQSKTLGSMLLDDARAKAGDQLVRAAAANIPGVSGYL